MLSARRQYLLQISGFHHNIEERYYLLQGEVSVWTLLLRTFECSPAIVSLCCGHLMSRCCTTVIEWTLHSHGSQTADLNPTSELCDRDETNLFREWVWIWIFAIHVTWFESNPESDKIWSINLDLEGKISKKLWIRIFGIEGKRFESNPNIRYNSAGWMGSMGTFSSWCENYREISLTALVNMWTNKQWAKIIRFWIEVVSPISAWSRSGVATCGVLAAQCNYKWYW